MWDSVTYPLLIQDRKMSISNKWIMKYNICQVKIIIIYTDIGEILYLMFNFSVHILMRLINICYQDYVKCFMKNILIFDLKGNKY